ncbi:MAG: hypothetical protein FJ096_12185 [Deltaproteobacteria bacterium]|nr:hypothetical protein [Deltaproteobacteria bacterium]
MKLRVPIGVDTPLGRRLVGLSFVRLVVLGIFLLVIELYYLDELGGFSSSVAVATAVGAFVTTALFALTLRRERWHVPMAHAQLLADQLTWTIIVYISGGVTSGSTSLYGLTSVSGAVLLGTPGVITASAAGGGLYFLMCHGFASGWLPPPSDQVRAAYILTPGDMVYPAFSTVLATLVVGLLAAYLAERLRVFGGRLEDANRRALEAERLASLGRLAAGLAHEIRNPLGSIRGSIELLRTGSGLAEEDQQLCRIIEQETARLNQLVTDMVDLSRPREPLREEVDLAQLVASVVELAKSSGRGEDLAVRYDGPRSLVAVVDCGQMHQVLWNLVRNAMQVSAAGQTVEVQLERESGGAAVLSVKDHGPGVDEATRDRLFEAFFTTRSHGVGIGLAVVKQIVDAHGFSIDVDSRPEEGATFSVRIPEKDLRDAEEPAKPRTPTVATAAATLLAMASYGCTGKDWVRPDAAPATTVRVDDGWNEAAPRATATATASPPPAPVGEAAPAPLPPLTLALGETAPASGSPASAPSGAVFRNTYYFFPEEPGYAETGPTRGLFDAKCRPIRTVSQTFHDQLCVQGSGRLASGETVSFARRGCECAAECPRSGQRICFELLDAARFPWGRGANGRAITPLKTVAVDDSIPLGTVLYVPEMNGLRDLEGKPHDGCFVAEDRGSKVKGRQIDFFVGRAEAGEVWNRAVPSNRGVHVVLGASQCAALASKDAGEPKAPKPPKPRRKKR